ncbi:similar to Saccharomyces cerevisiae YPL068C Protein of unknown function [Maudiozyma saulgeensis]|uniref:Uncharacterized protein n=1 Tax=Maudiozyma saulgeensis TaxID=1789683 RepID=A0A1X7R6B1_9SACH|nr:similar to Saccharomyces cerevisiae YPL068C Protein of unknown function [Kazachstania saulgeensis]
MQLRKRKRVDYSSTIEASHGKIKNSNATDNLQTTTHSRTKQRKSIVLPKIISSSSKQKNYQVGASKKKQSPSKRLSEEKILNEKMKGVTLTRPFYKSQVNYHDEKDAIITISELNQFSRTLDKLIPVQRDLYYLDLKGPKYLGPKNFETLKLPSDINNLQNISNELKQFINYREEAKVREEDLKNDPSKINEASYNPIITKEKMEGIKVLSKFEDIPGFEIIDRLAQIHNINIRDIHGLRQANIKPMLDSNFINKNEVNSISRRLDKKLQKERNNNLAWPTKIKKKKTQTKKNKAKDENSSSKLRFSNIQLFNSV